MRRGSKIEFRWSLESASMALMRFVMAGTILEPEHQYKQEAARSSRVETQGNVHHPKSTCVKFLDAKGTVKRNKVGRNLENITSFTARDCDHMRNSFQSWRLGRFRYESGRCLCTEPYIHCFHPGQRPNIFFTLTLELILDRTSWGGKLKVETHSSIIVVNQEIFHKLACYYTCPKIWINHIFKSW